MNFTLIFAAAIFCISHFVFANSHIEPTPAPLKEKLANLEKTFNGRIGIYAINTNNNQTNDMCFKTLLS